LFPFFSLSASLSISLSPTDEGVLTSNYGSGCGLVFYFTVLPRNGNPIKISSPSEDQLRPILSAVQRAVAGSPAAHRGAAQMGGGNSQQQQQRQHQRFGNEEEEEQGAISRSGSSDWGMAKKRY